MNLKSGMTIIAALFCCWPWTNAAEIKINLAPDAPGTVAENMLNRSLFAGSPDRPVHLGARGVGTFAEKARLTVPFEVPAAGSYRAVLRYGLLREPDMKRNTHQGDHIKGNARETRLVSIRLDGEAQAGWQIMELWPTAPTYEQGSRQLYNRNTGIRNWTISPAAVELAAGRHSLELEVSGGSIMFESLTLTTGKTPENPAVPQLMQGYTAFPALEFTGREIGQGEDGRTRITFRGKFANLATIPVSYEMTAAVLPRAAGPSRFRVVAVEPAGRLALALGEETPFTLTAEADGPLAADWSELIRLNLKSLDVKGLPAKPYLMSTAQAYLQVNPEGKMLYTKAYNDGKSTVQNGTDMRFVVPNREHLGLKDGRYARNITEAFVQALASAPPENPVKTLGRHPADKEMRYDLSALAREGKLPPRFDTWDRVLGAVLAGAGQKTVDIATLKAMLLRLAQEYPYYPVSRWDANRPTPLPNIQWVGTDVYPLASYVKLLQERAVTDDEHFLFLHNVILPYLVQERDDWRQHGTLAEAAKAGDTVVVLQRETPENLLATDFLADWLRIGTGDRVEYVRQESGKGHASRFTLDADHPGPLKFDHPAGTPWASFRMTEFPILEGTDVWPLMCLMISSCEPAVIELCSQRLEVVFNAQHLYREDGSFVEEPGSYGMGGFNYVRMVENIEHFMGRGAARLSDRLREKMFRALCMWNELPFSDGYMMMMNQHGALNQVPPKPEPLQLLKSMYPDRAEEIARYGRLAEHWKTLTPGAVPDNRSVKIDGWGYALLRGPGAWDGRMEALLASKKGQFDPAHHMSRDCMSLWFFAHGAIMTPRYGYHWINPPCAVMYNQVMINKIGNNYWGWFAHFDAHPEMPSAVAVTDMSGSFSHKPGFARLQRWVVQLPEYAFDLFEIKPRDGGEHRYAWGYRNLGEMAVVSPAGTELKPILEADGKPWDPIGFYRKNTGKEGLGFETTGAWQAEWTLNEGSIYRPDNFPYPPRGARLRLSMAAGGPTRVVAAWLRGPARNGKFEIRQDFVEVTRRGRDAVFAAAYEPVAAGAAAQVGSIELLPETAPDGARVARVKTGRGEDWFLAGGTGLETPPPVRRLGPFETDAALTVVRVVDGKAGQVLLRGGTMLRFAHGGVSVELQDVRREETRHAKP